MANGGGGGLKGQVWCARCGRYVDLPHDQSASAHDAIVKPAR